MCLTYHLTIASRNSAMARVESDQISGWYHITSQGMDCYVHAFGKAIRSLFTDPVIL